MVKPVYFRGIGSRLLSYITELFCVKLLYSESLTVFNFVQLLSTDVMFFGRFKMILSFFTNGETLFYYIFIFLPFTLIKVPFLGVLYGMLSIPAYGVLQYPGWFWNVFALWFRIFLPLLLLKILMLFMFRIATFLFSIFRF